MSQASSDSGWSSSDYFWAVSNFTTTNLTRGLANVSSDDAQLSSLQADFMCFAPIIARPSAENLRLG